MTDERPTKRTATDSCAPFTYYDSANDLAALLAHLGIERAVLAGMSQGGYLSLRCALTHPALVRALILIDTQAMLEELTELLEGQDVGLMLRAGTVEELRPQGFKLSKAAFKEIDLGEVDLKTLRVADKASNERIRITLDSYEFGPLFVGATSLRREARNQCLVYRCGAGKPMPQPVFKIL